MNAVCATAMRVEMRKLASMVGTARRLVCGGTMVELAALGEKVDEVCRAVQALPVEEGRALRPELEALLRDLGGLGEDLTAQHERACGAEPG